MAVQNLLKKTLNDSDNLFISTITNTIMNRIISKTFSLLFALAIFVSFGTLKAQCDITNFTATPIQGTCTQDGKINVSVTGATNCTGPQAFATLQDAAGNTIEFLPLNNSGNMTFLNLLPGKYSVRVMRTGMVATTVDNIMVTTRYNPMVISTSRTNTSCASTDTMNPPDGSVVASHTGGTGPFVYDLILNGAIKATSGSITTRSFTFNNLSAGEYNVRVTDNSTGCPSAVTQSATVASTISNPLNFYYDRFRPDETTCGKVTYRFAVINGYSPGLKKTGAATAKKNGVPISSSSSGGGAFNFTELSPGDLITDIRVTDGCNTVSRSDFTVPSISPQFDDFLSVNLIGSQTNCVSTNDVLVSGLITERPPGAPFSFAFQTNNSLTLLKESPFNSGTYVQTQQFTNVTQLSVTGGGFIIRGLDLNERYKLVAMDDCHTVEKIFLADGVYNNPLTKSTLREANSLLQGTSTIEIRGENGGTWGSTEPLNFPITATINREEGNTTIVAAHPYELGGTFNYTFPFDVIYPKSLVPAHTWSNHPNIGNLPLGNYVVTLTDACDYFVTRTIELKAPATYNPSITFNTGCDKSDIMFDLNETGVADFVFTELYKNNNGSLGALVRNAAENPTNKYSGQFSAIPPGEYFIKFSNARFRAPLRDKGDFDQNNWQSDIKQLKLNREYKVAVTVPPYEQVAFSTTSSFCDTNNNDSGILSIEATGIPIGGITYSIWADTLNPDTDTPTQTSGVLAPTAVEFLFENLSSGTYKVRVITDCGFTEQTVDLRQGVTIFPEPYANPANICVEDATTLSIAIPENLYDFIWKDSGGNTVGDNANSIIVSPIANETYTVTYTLKSTLGCATVPKISDPILVTVTECVCYNDPNMTDKGIPSNHGITLLQRAGSNNGNWPMVRTSAHTVLESNQKGLVITRMTSDPAQSAAVNYIANVTNPVEGMMIYDTFSKCLKIYNGTAWNCFSTATCP
ncbi:hypothetical protein HY04_09460 [Kaistella antarctica]|uniref:SD-repeat containing protein B domain-containing protein n=2 Tax=Kaistella antarctica TaxID=266748 RepID=A0ABR4TXT2_9FLAO|nr:hypothetical protein HY04_09460 [Kaistella antarctica]